MSQWISTSEQTKNMIRNTEYLAVTDDDSSPQKKQKDKKKKQN